MLGYPATVNPLDHSVSPRGYRVLSHISRLPEAEARFLTQTSVLHRMCGGLCDAVLETTHSAHTLESLERAGST